MAPDGQLVPPNVYDAEPIPDAARAEIEALRGEVPEAAPDVDLMLDFLAAADRGIVR